MGNARWKGVRLRDVLSKGGVKKEAIEIAFDGADRGVTDATPDFRKSIPVWKAQDENTLLAWEMNGEPLPHLNGAPLRVIVPGWTATYWMKKLTSIEAIDKPLATFWMNTAYRVPKGKFAFADRFLTQESDASTPITEMVVNSIITSIRDGQKVAVGQDTDVRGVAWDGGYGMAALYLLAQRSPQKGIAFVGGRRRLDILCEQEFRALGWEVRAATEDGSHGEKGLVTQPLQAELRRETQCGAYGS